MICDVGVVRVKQATSTLPARIHVPLRSRDLCACQTPLRYTGTTSKDVYFPMSAKQSVEQGRVAGGRGEGGGGEGDREKL